MAFRGGAILLMAVVTAIETPAPAAPTPVCARLKAPLRLGDFVLSRELERTDCPDPPPAHSFGYDAAARLARARSDLAAGAIVRAPPAFAVALYRPGDRVRLVAKSGPVQIEREVEVVAGARRGGSILVRGGADKPFEVPADEVRP